METRHLIAGIVRQTTVLIAQLSTAAGLRAPLSRVADQVFLNLARELEAQGVTRKVAADMFGLALRSYQLKVSRITESASVQQQTLWEAVLDELRSSGGCTRKRLVERFARDNSADLAAVLNDLVQSGLASRTGKGQGAYYEPASSEAMAAIALEQQQDAFTAWVWLAIYDRKRTTRDALCSELSADRAAVDAAVDCLLSEGRIDADQTPQGERLSCTRLAIPWGAEQGWETAVFDHFRAMATAIAGKLQAGGTQSGLADVQGGSTLTFGLGPGHPHAAEVYGLLGRMRGELQALWDRVSQYNQQHPIEPDARSEVTFYFGQSVVAARAEGEDR